MRESRREFSQLEGLIVIAQTRRAAQPATVALQVVGRETVHRHMLGRQCAAVAPRFAVPIGSKGGMRAGALVLQEIARQQGLSVAVISNRESAEYRLAKAGAKTVHDTHCAVIKAVEFFLIAKHCSEMHLAFDKGKATP